MTDNVLVVDRKPSVKEYLSLRKAVEFQLMPEDSVARGLDNSLFAVCAVSSGRIVGMARVIAMAALASMFKMFSFSLNFKGGEWGSNYGTHHGLYRQECLPKRRCRADVNKRVRAFL
ncbi:hypothetical protein [Paenibacillus sabinae]|uniref:hypothetical protein n=1 Tax=Paenibacillus sabinae TaxID=365617 RepID=UPI0011861B94|nr:hypothetical protein [Paenibacillus sabinae]